MLVRLFRDTRLLYIYQALKILVVNIYNCYKKSMTFLMDLFFWCCHSTYQNPECKCAFTDDWTTFASYHTFLILLLWNCLMHCHALWYSSNYPLRSLHRMLQRLWNLALYKTLILLFVNSCKVKQKPSDWLSSFNGSSYWSNPPESPFWEKLMMKMTLFLPIFYLKNRKRNLTCTTLVLGAKAC